MAESLIQPTTPIECWSRKAGVILKGTSRNTSQWMRSLKSLEKTGRIASYLLELMIHETIQISRSLQGRMIFSPLSWSLAGFNVQQLQLSMGMSKMLTGQLIREIRRLTISRSLRQVTLDPLRGDWSHWGSLKRTKMMETYIAQGWMNFKTLLKTSRRERRDHSLRSNWNQTWP